MIPLFAVIKFRNRKNDRWRGFRLWIPLFLVWVLLLPVVLLLVPFAVLTLRLAHMKAGRSLAAFWQLLCSLRGMHIEFEVPDHGVFVRVY